MMLERIKKIVKNLMYLVIILAIILAYVNNRIYVNNIFPIEDLTKNVWYGFKSLISKLDVVPEYVQKFEVQKVQRQQKQEENPKPKMEPLVVNVQQTIIQKKSGKELYYGFDKYFNLVKTTDGENESFFEYSQDGNLQKISSGKRIINFSYNSRGQLIKINDSEDITQLKYDFYGGLKTVNYPYDTLLFMFDATGRLFTFQQNTGYETKFTYYHNKIAALVKAGTSTLITYGQNKLIKIVQTNKDYLVLNYGRNNLLSLMAGNKYGLGETISYNPNDETVISSNDDSIFTGETEQARITALNIYLTCTKFKKLPVLFDPLAYTLYNNYFKQDVVSYLINNYICNVVYGRKV